MRGGVHALALSLATILAFLACLQTAGAAEQEAPAANPRDVRAHFVQCFQTPRGMEKMQGTFHFSLNREGGLIGPPRIAWLQLGKRHQSQKQLEQRLIEAFDRCVPVPLTKEMSLLTPGNVLYFRLAPRPGTARTSRGRNSTARSTERESWWWKSRLGPRPRTAKSEISSAPDLRAGNEIS